MSSAMNRKCCARGEDGFLTFTRRIAAISRIGRVITKCHGGCCSTQRYYCTCVLNPRHARFHTGSSNRPSSATNGPVLKRVAGTRLASVLVIIVHCFKKIGLNADKLVITCHRTTVSTLTRYRRMARRMRRVMACSFACPVVGSIVEVIGRVGPHVISRAFSGAYDVGLSVEGDRTRRLHAHLGGLSFRWFQRIGHEFSRIDTAYPK